MQIPDNFSGQVTGAIMKAFSYFNPDRIIAVNQVQYDKILSHVYDTLHSTGLDERMSADYETLNAYKRDMRERYKDGIDVLEKQFPNGMFTKDNDGDLVGINIMMKKIVCELLENATLSTSWQNCDASEPGVQIFRGKRTDNNEWVTGSLVKTNYHNSIDFVELTQIVANNAHEFEVWPHSVGQATDVPDKKGNEVFSGDILAIDDEEIDDVTGYGQGPTVPFAHIVEVIFQDGAFGVVMPPECKWMHGFTTLKQLIDDYGSEGFEIIGNKTDCPELIQAQTQC